MVNSLSTIPITLIVKMSLENLVRMLGVNNIKLTSKIVMLREFLVRDNFCDFVIIIHSVRVALASYHEAHLFESHAVLTFSHKLINHVHVVHFLCNT